MDEVQRVRVVGPLELYAAGSRVQHLTTLPDFLARKDTSQAAIVSPT